MESESKQLNISPSISIIIAGVIIAGAIIFANRYPVQQPIVANPEQQQAAPAADVSKVKTDGEAFIGNANAPVTMAYWYDYQCPFCQRNEEETMPQIIKNYVDTGKVKIVFKDYQFLGPDSQTLAQVSRAVWDTVPTKFYQWHKAVFDNQGTENSGWATKETILSITTGVLEATDAQKVMQLATANAAAYQKEMDADKAEGTAMGINGTPGSIIGKQLVSGAQPYSAFQVAIETALKNQ